MATPTTVYYPQSDGKPMAENTVQFEWIVTLHTNLDRLFADRPDVFVGGDNFWYPVEGRPRIVQAPDVYVALGRPRGHRPSYKQWEEGGIAPQVVFEVLSPGNRAAELERKRRFYRRYGVQEYYILNPDECWIDAHLRDGKRFRLLSRPADHTSPLLGIRFVVRPGTDVRVYFPDGQPFQTAAEIVADRDREKARVAELLVDRDREKARAAELRAARDQEKARAAELAADRDREKARVAELMAQLRALGVDPDAG